MSCSSFCRSNVGGGVQVDKENQDLRFLKSVLKLK